MELREVSPAYLAQQAPPVPKGYKQTEVGVIPEDWEIRSLGNEIDRLEAGVSVNSVNEVQRIYPHDQAILKTSAVINGRFLANEAKKIVPREIRRAKINPRANTIIISRMNTPELVGECGYVDVDYPNLFLPDRLWMSKFRQGSDICVKWLAYLLSSREYKYKLKGSATGTSGSMKNLSKEAFLSLIISYPSSNEQRAIASALSDVDALLAKLDQLIAKKRDLKQAAMQQLLTGKTRLPGFGGEWEFKRLGDIADTDPENLSSSTNPNYVFNYIALEDVNCGNLDGYSEVTYSAAPSRARRRLREGDILMATVRPNLKAHLLFKGFEGEWVCSTGFCVIRSREGVSDPGYLMQHLFAHPINKQIEALIAGSNYPAINNKDVRALEIPMPLYDEQTAIATVLSDIDAEIAALESRRDKTRLLKQGMMQELLTGRIRLV